MSETNNTPQAEQQMPTKEEIMKFLQEQIDVKKLQLELQELNAGIAAARAEELKALSFVAQMTNPQQMATKQHVVTQEDLDNNPELVDAGVGVGDEIMIPDMEQEAPKPSTKKLKKETA